VEPLDEIWAPSAFIQSALSRSLAIPIVHMPHGIEVNEIEACSPAELGVPAGRFTFLSMLDLDSYIERKNPRGAVAAFSRAFADDERVALLIKTTNAHRHREEYEDLLAACGAVTNVFIADVTMPRRRVNGLIAACDAVVSLHRSEGFGLILAEAMFLGKPVVATGWSGNMDFMREGNSCPVAFELETLKESHGPYASGQRWAEPDVDHAASLMRRLFADASFAGEIGKRAIATIREEFSPAVAGERYRRRLGRLGLLGD
jgi:glycosyltransferase involved in cell wall biosynthesis